MRYFYGDPFQITLYNKIEGGENVAFEPGGQSN